MKKRIEYIDTAKAIAMLFVIIGHCDWINTIPRLYGMIYSFHMPVFFIISGYFIKRMSFKQSMYKYARAYIKPYALLALFIICVSLSHAYCYKDNLLDSFKLSVLRVIWCAAGNRSNVCFDLIPDIGPSWFLPALFTSCVIYSSFVVKYNKMEQILLCLILACFAVSTISKIQLPFGIQYGMVALVYLVIGNHIEDMHIFERMKAIDCRIKYFAVFSCVLLTFTNGGVYVWSANLGYSIQGLVCSIIISLAIIYTCKYRFRAHFEWIGKNTLYIFMAHVMFREFIMVFDCGFKHLHFISIFNLLIEMPIQIFVALSLGYVFSKIKPQKNI